MTAVELQIIPGSAYALGFRGGKMLLQEQNEMLAREWRRYTIFGPEKYVGYFADHPEHVEPYRAMLTAPPPTTVDGPLTEKLKTARAALDVAIALAEVAGH